MSRVPYPPCNGCTCTGNRCRIEFPDPNIKLEWPELVGVNEKVAKAKIESTNPFVTVVVLYDGFIPLADVCCNRVYLFANHPNGVVTKVPQIG